MFWLLVFTAVALTLAWRAVPLTTATGALGVCVLLYGWLGESSGRFVLLLLIWLALMIPLNTAALRQEWFSRPLLARWLALRGSRLSSPANSTGEPLAEGRWDEAMAAALANHPKSEPNAVDAGLRSEALAAALAARLRQPCDELPVDAATAGIARALYAAAALRAQGLAPLSHSAAWALAADTAALLGRAPESAMGWAAAPDAVLLTYEQALQRHRLNAALIAAAAEPQAAARLLAFDAAFWTLSGHALTQAVRALVGGIGVYLLPPGEEDARLAAARRQAQLGSSRLALLLDLQLLAPLVGQHERPLLAPLASAWAALREVLALLAFHETSRRPATERELVLSALATAQHRFELALAACLREIRPPLARLLLRLCVFPLGARAAPATAAVERASASALLREPLLRARLLDADVHPALAALGERVEALNRLEPVLRRLRQLRFDPPPADARARIAAAAKLGALSEEESSALVEALAFAETLDLNSPDSGRSVS